MYGRGCGIYTVNYCNCYIDFYVVLSHETVSVALPNSHQTSDEVFM
jgi:hypothetical protein